MLPERLATDRTQAMRDGDAIRKSAIRMALAGIKNAEKAKGHPLDDSEVIDCLSREAKQHRESIAEFAKGGRSDLIAKEEAELAVILEYLPQQMSREEVVAAARQVVERVGARGPGDKGKVMSQLMPGLKGKADGREVNEVVSELLAGL